MYHFFFFCKEISCKYEYPSGLAEGEWSNTPTELWPRKFACQLHAGTVAVTWQGSLTENCWDAEWAASARIWKWWSYRRWVNKQITTKKKKCVRKENQVWHSTFKRLLEKSRPHIMRQWSYTYSTLFLSSHSTVSLIAYTTLSLFITYSSLFHSSYISLCFIHRIWHFVSFITHISASFITNSTFPFITYIIVSFTTYSTGSLITYYSHSM